LVFIFVFALSSHFRLNSAWLVTKPASSPAALILKTVANLLPLTPSAGISFLGRRGPSHLTWPSRVF
jgi:hypothetical protein